jgi:hypothetical protein
MMEFCDGKVDRVQILTENDKTGTLQGFGRVVVHHS